MTHDLTHCKGIGCPKKHGCLRYLAHLDASEDGIPYLPYTTEMIDHGYCPMYLRCENVYQGITHYNNRNKQ